MKKLKYIAMAFAALLFASCMGDGYAEPDLSSTPIGNNEIKEGNVITIAQLKSDYSSQISSKQFVTIDKDVQIKGIVTGNDFGGNLYNEVCLQDETGGILVCINANGLYGTLPVGQEILINLKGLYIGGYGSQAEVGGVYTNTSTGAQSIGKVDRYIWEQHYKVIGLANAEKAESMVEEFDQSKIKDADYLKNCSGKLMTIKGVTFVNNDGKTVYAPDEKGVKDNSNCVNRNLKGISSSSMVVRTSAYAKFANNTLPTGPVNITGIFTRYNNVWQILIRTIDDVQPDNSGLSIFSESFAESQGAFTINDISLSEGLEYAWKWAGSNYGMKASAHVGSSDFASESRLTSPLIDLSKVSKATLEFDHAAKFFGSNFDDYLKLQVSEDGKTWTNLAISKDQLPDGQSWTFVHATNDLSKYCGKKIYVGFLYKSTENTAATWEIKNFTVK